MSVRVARSCRIHWKAKPGIAETVLVSDAGCVGREGISDPRDDGHSLGRVVGPLHRGSGPYGYRTVTALLVRDSLLPASSVYVTLTLIDAPKSPDVGV